jgi:hypothetical protein
VNRKEGRAEKGNKYLKDVQEWIEIRRIRNIFCIH